MGNSRKEQLYLLRISERHATAEHITTTSPKMVRKINLMGCGIECFSIATVLLPLHICMGCWSLASNISPSTPAYQITQLY
jgi:hypothetical protein